VLQVGTASVVVPSSASITSRGNTLAFSDLKVGQSVEIHGTMQGSTVTADRVNIEDNVEPAPRPEPQPEPQEDEFTGSITALGGGCPALTMTVAGRSVVTNSATEFKKTSCAAIAMGNSVQVKGTAQAGGSILASRVQAEDK
jgi:hypothetical protein